MDSFPLYVFGYIPELASVVGMRADQQDKALQDLQKEFGDRISALNFNVFGSIQFLERKGNAFGRACYRYDAKGAGTQVYERDKEFEHLYAFLHLAGARATTAFLQKDGSHWPRLLAWRLSESTDVANLLTEAGVIQASALVSA